MDKIFYIKKEDIKELVNGYGSCYATDEITVKGKKVNYMYREKPNHPSDSGWRFFAGNESQDYVDNPTNMSNYNMNTIANYDPTIIPQCRCSRGFWVWMG